MHQGQVESVNDYEEPGLSSAWETGQKPKFVKNIANSKYRWSKTNNPI